ncbi:MAG: PD-(D/E)XK nuclease family protein [Acidobacteriia bacterium]|nr:PD-(D/E)XK nuclease family protein [Terriglobia bacterium]
MNSGTSEVSLTISGVSERDVDLLLLEEFIASPGFVRWFMKRLALKDGVNHKVISAHRSVTQSIGESDIEVVLSNSEGHTHYLLIENKIGASLQPRQADRYHERARTYQEQGRCKGFTTVLVAPKNYFGSGPRRTKGFDAAISYEEIAAWFAAQKSLGRRLRYKQYLLESAIKKAVHGYQPVEDAPVSGFWHSYWLLSLREAPELEMLEPRGKPSSAGFIYFRPGVLRRGVCIVHKLPRGHLDLQFAGKAGRLASLRSKLGASMLPGMTIERAAKSAVIRQKVPVFNTARDFQRQEADVVYCLRLARDLLRWYLKLQK